MINRNLQDLLSPLGFKVPNKILKGITLDSRKVKTGYLFLAVKGHKTDGRKYISEAIEKGVSTVIAEGEKNKKSKIIQYINDVPIIYIHDLNNHLSFLAGKFYNNPAKKLRIIGITGTNGKTTISYLIAQLAKGLGEISAVMGTIGNGILNQIVPKNHTTGSAIDIQSDLQLLVDKKATFVSMEVSSHGLIQSRVASIPFKATLFSNLSHDHLDYHGNIKNYEAAKWLLFSTHQSDKKIINVDDEIGLKWLKKLPKACAVSIKNKIPKDWSGVWVSVEKVYYHDDGSIICFDSSWGKNIFKSPLIGIFNVNNIMLAIATFLMLGYPLNMIIESLNFLQPIYGRMEVFRSPKYPIVIVDYAHTPDALKKALIGARLHCIGMLWCVFGCGGDRDKTKRALMGSIAEKYADFVILTDDNPRTEKSQAIINDIFLGFNDTKRVKKIVGRVKAIASVIMEANINDVILIAGKGHEDYQIIGNRRIHYSDRLTVSRLLGVI
ncbi:UDP-N-acetylmuramoyl-L-alanyl-D-glutamate--2,6-diaminopimelate ligase [Arsenophonus symbiont of Ornithomya chloropus]|uniref:UDP-N-acetylmuramoyl-L-alanyl-D-glutamate--2, 6-diaminopimelate ligase n=1 Tax=Arsenophonus symbiont of Ornithomya chloropus TaxID=634121 RepID=UPI0032B1FF2F